MKRIIAAVLVLTMALAFAGCAKTEAPATTAAPETTVAAETTAAAVETTAATEAVETTAAAEVAVMTHEEFVAAPVESPVSLVTYVQGHQSWWDNKVTVYCQGADGAYFLYELQCSEEDAAKLVPGTKIAVTGYKAEWAGEVEVIDGTFTFVEDGETFVAEPVDMTALLGTEELIAHQNELAAFNGLTVEAIEYKNGEPGDDVYLTLGKDGNSYNFCVEIYLTGAESEVYTTVSQLQVGDVVNVEGYVYWYEGVNPHVTAIEVVK